MRTSKSAAFAAAVAILALLPSCSPSAMTKGSPPLLLTTGSGYMLGPQDKVRLSLYGDEEFSGEYLVAADGMVSLPLIGAVQAAGNTINQLRQDIVAQLANGYYVDPRVTAEISEFRPFYIYGEINRPGNYSYVPELTLGRAVAIASGYTYRAYTDTILVQRTGSDQVFRVRVDQAFRIGPGDTIKIPERYF